MKVRVLSFTPFKFGNYITFSFCILPELSFFWLGGLDTVYFSWLFFEITFRFKK